MCPCESQKQKASARYLLLKGTHFETGSFVVTFFQLVKLAPRSTAIWLWSTWQVAIRSLQGIGWQCRLCLPLDKGPCEHGAYHCLTDPISQGETRGLI